MTTSRDLLLTVMDRPEGGGVDKGDLSLALAGAETVDLLTARAVTLDGDRLAVAPGGEAGEALLGEALALLAQEPAGQTVDDWLWHRGRGLTAVYLAALEADGSLVREQVRRWGFLRDGRLVPADSPARRRAGHRWSADDPVFMALAAAVGLREEDPPPDLEPPGGPVGEVLDAVRHAVLELTEERRLRTTRLDRANALYRSRGF